MIEASGEYIESWVEVGQSEELFDAYREAMAAGLVALEAEIDDFDVGPREALLEPLGKADHSGLFGAAVRRDVLLASALHSAAA